MFWWTLGIFLGLNWVMWWVVWMCACFTGWRILGWWVTRSELLECSYDAHIILGRMGFGLIFMFLEFCNDLALVINYLPSSPLLQLGPRLLLTSRSLRIGSQFTCAKTPLTSWVLTILVILVSNTPLREFLTWPSNHLWRMCPLSALYKKTYMQHQH